MLAQAFIAARMVDAGPFRKKLLELIDKGVNRDAEINGGQGEIVDLAVEEAELFLPDSGGRRRGVSEAAMRIASFINTCQ
ncbi:MAG: hypothetical protein QOG91_539 [Candidatus Parcubacteria bacterium]|jgi:hypothetical protein|nr:hypothetical protein [Candidatus Parcubacteria bacterium]